MLGATFTCVNGHEFVRDVRFAHCPECGSLTEMPTAEETVVEVEEVEEEDTKSKKK